MWFFFYIRGANTFFLCQIRLSNLHILLFVKIDLHLCLVFFGQLVLKSWQSHHWLFLKFLDTLEVIFGKSGKFPRYIQQYFWVNLGASVHLTVTVDAASVQILFIKHHNDFGFCLPYNCASCAERDILS
jgi:hypothetical protein